MQLLQRFNDLIVPNKHGLWVCFDGTGMKRKAQLFELPIRSMAIQHDSETDGGGYRLVVGTAEADVFPNEKAARSARRRLIKATRPALARWGTTFGKSVGVVLIGAWLLGNVASPSPSPASAATTYPPALPPGPSSQLTPSIPGFSAAGVTPENLASLGISGMPSGPVDVKSIPMDDAIPMGSKGKPKILIFSDPECVACRSLEGTLGQVSKDLDIRILPVPAQGAESLAKIAQVFCSDDQQKSWADAMGGKAVNMTTTDRAKIEHCVQRGLNNFTVMNKLQMGVTPVIVRADGAVATGALPADKLLAFANGK